MLKIISHYFTAIVCACGLCFASNDAVIITLDFSLYDLRLLDWLIILFFNKKTVNTSSNRQQAPAEHAGLVKEAWWLFFSVIGVYLVLILGSYYPNDPSWSHNASDNAVIQNAGGVVGAWVSDMLLYIFGFST